jgi:hypothetical protein
MDDLRPAKSKLDEVTYALERVCIYLRWVDEHRGSFERYRDVDKEEAESELANLRDATENAREYAKYLAKLLLSGRQIDLTKPPPDWLKREIEQ